MFNWWERPINTKLVYSIFLFPFLLFSLFLMLLSLTNFRHSVLVNTFVQHLSIKIESSPTSLPVVILVSPTNVQTTTSYQPDINPLDPNRKDWMISQTNSEHWLNEGLGGEDFAYVGNRDAIGSQLIATHNGVVDTRNDYGTGNGYGNMTYLFGFVDPKTGVSYNAIYGHQSKFLIATGQQVSKGQVIGLMGSTGFSSGPHLHYELWRCQLPTEQLLEIGSSTINRTVDCHSIDPDSYVNRT